LLNPWSAEQRGADLRERSVNPGSTYFERSGDWMDDAIRDLRRLAGYGASLQELVTDLQERAPARSEGTDRSGAVQAVLGRDGLPEVIRVDSGWTDRLDPRAFAGAVTESCGAAARERGLAWSQALEQSGWQRRADELHADRARLSSVIPGPVIPGTVPAAFMRADVRPQPLDQLAEEALALNSEVRSAAARSQGPRLPRPGTGSNRTRTVTLTVAAGGQVSCQADPRWVTDKSGGQLSEALAEALAAARANLASSSEPAGGRNDFAGRQERLLAEIFAVLNNLQRGI
jgi:hypothetical protein